MKLKEYLEAFPEDRTLYLGASVGFIFGGLKVDLLDQLPQLNKKYCASALSDYRTAYDKYRNLLKSIGKSRPETKRAKKKLEALTPFVPFEDREIQDIYDRTSEDATNVVVTGDERGRLWSVYEGTDEWNTVKAEYNAEGLVAAIISSILDDYKHDLSVELGELRKILEKLEEYRSKDKKWENYLRSNNFLTSYGIDPEYVINKTRDKVCDDIRYCNSQKRRWSKREM